MNFLYNQNYMFNQTYVNEQYLKQLQAQVHQNEQNAEIYKAARAIRDYCEAVKPVFWHVLQWYWKNLETEHSIFNPSLRTSLAPLFSQP